MLEKIYQKSLLILQDFQDMSRMAALPFNCSFFEYYEERKMDGRKFLFALECRADRNEKTEEESHLKRWIGFTW